MDENLRKAIVAVVQHECPDFDIDTVAQEGATEYGYFRFTGGIENGTKRREYVMWDSKMRETISKYPRLFEEWFNGA